MRLLVLLLLSVLFVCCRLEIVAIDAEPGDASMGEGDHHHQRDEDPNPIPDLSVPLLGLETGGFTPKHKTLSTEGLEILNKVFYKWLGEEGATASTSLNIEYIEEMDERGLITNEELKDGQIIAKLPRHVLISSLPPLETDPEDIPFCDLMRRWPHSLLTRLFTPPKGQEPLIAPSRASNVLLALGLIHETKKSGGSFYQAYLNILPQEFTQPLTWKQSSLKKLQNSPIYQAVMSAKKQLEEDYSHLAEILFTHPNQGFTLEHYNWAMLIVSTRAQELVVHERSTPIKALVPVVDMINMSRGFIDHPSIAIQAREVEESHFFEFSCQGGSFPAGSQVLREDSPCANSLCYLLNHGYLPPHLKNDFIPLNIIGEDNSILYAQLLKDYAKAEVTEESLLELKSDILLQNHLDVIRLGVDFYEGTMLVFRFLCATKSQVGDLIREKSFSFIESKLSRTNEMCALDTLTDLLEHTIYAYPTSLLMDRLLISKLPEDGDVEVALALQMRATEKQILNDFLGLITTNREMLE